MALKEITPRMVEVQKPEPAREDYLLKALLCLLLYIKGGGEDLSKYTELLASSYDTTRNATPPKQLYNMG